MADLTLALKNVANGLDKITDPSGKYVILTDPNGTLSGKMKANIMLNEDDFVDLGLPSGRLWAKKNVGAATEFDYGLYFSWGNIQGHQEGAGYDFSQAVYETTKGYTLTTDLTLEEDAAHAYLGGGWKMPSTDDFAELFNSTYTTSEWTYLELPNGDRIYGRRVVSKADANKSVFFPAGGYFNGTSLSSRGSNGYYWSSTRRDGTNARYLYFNSSGVNPQNGDGRRYGFSVRAVL